MAAYHRELDEVKSYLREMEVPRPIVDTMVATGSSEIQWVDAKKDHLERPPSFAEWEDASCGDFTAEEENTLTYLMGKEDQNHLNQNEHLLYKLLEDKEVKYIGCKSNFCMKQRAQLSSP